MRRPLRERVTAGSATVAWEAPQDYREPITLDIAGWEDSLAALVARPGEWAVVWEMNGGGVTWGDGCDPGEIRAAILGGRLRVPSGVWEFLPRARTHTTTGRKITGGTAPRLYGRYLGDSDETLVVANTPTGHAYRIKHVTDEPRTVPVEDRRLVATA